MSNYRPVYSDETGRLCPKCSKPVNGCICNKSGVTKTGDGIIRVSRSTAGRKGKGVTIITGVPLEEKALKALAKKLKQKCGSGGTLKDGVIEIQGEHRDFLVEELQNLGWTVKRSGG